MVSRRYTRIVWKHPLLYRVSWLVNYLELLMWCTVVVLDSTILHSLLRWCGMLAGNFVTTPNVCSGAVPCRADKAHNFHCSSNRNRFSLWDDAYSDGMVTWQVFVQERAPYTMLSIVTYHGWWKILSRYCSSNGKIAATILMCLVFSFIFWQQSWFNVMGMIRSLKVYRIIRSGFKYSRKLYLDRKLTFSNVMTPTWDPKQGLRAQQTYLVSSHYLIILGFEMHLQP